MTSFDDLILDQCIRRRVGQPGTVTRILPDAASPMATFRDLAERLSGGTVELVSVTDGIPGHFGLRGAGHQTVVFHQRQVEVCAYLHGLFLEQRFEQQLLLEDLFEGTMLRLIAEFLLQGGHTDHALATLARSREILRGLYSFGPTIDELTKLKRDERYLVEWFFALGHEIGHNLAAELAADLGDLEWLHISTIDDLTQNILDARFSADECEILTGIIRRGDTGERPRSHASARTLREEAIADVFAMVCLSEAWSALCAENTSDAYSPTLLLAEAMISMSSVTAIEQCRIMASWFSNVSNEVEQQALILSGVALQTRINLLQLTMRDRDTQAILTARYPSMQVFALVDEPAFANAARYIETRSQQMQAPFGRARGFLSAPGMLDAERLQAYFEDVANDAVTRADASSFLRVARHVQSPLLDALHDITLGGEPPSVSTVRMGQS